MRNPWSMLLVVAVGARAWWQSDSSDGLGDDDSDDGKAADVPEPADAKAVPSALTHVDDGHVGKLDGDNDVDDMAVVSSAKGESRSRRPIASSLRVFGLPAGVRSGGAEGVFLGKWIVRGPKGHWKVGK